MCKDSNMARRQTNNCWEIKKCGREPSGTNADSLGVCPAATNEACEGLNHGKNAGRICWAVSGTLCGGVVQGIFALKIDTCLRCEVFRMVSDEEGHDFILRPEEILPDHLRVPSAKKTSKNRP
jgi:hypothetical protein